MAALTADGYRTFALDGRRRRQQRPCDRRRGPIRRRRRGGHDALHAQGDRSSSPSAVARALRGRLDERFATAQLGGLDLDARELRRDPARQDPRLRHRPTTRACGAQLIEELARIPADAEPASEFRYRNPVIEPDTLYVAVSQSGETADTLWPCRRSSARAAGSSALVNVVGRDDRARVRRHLPARRARDRGRLDQGVHQHAGRARAARAAPRPASATWPPADGERADRRACARCPTQIERSWPARRDRRDRASATPRPTRCSSSAASAATRWRARARRSSRRSPTSTPRPTRPASSSTGRSR